MPVDRRREWLPKDKTFVKEYIRRKVRESKTVYRDGKQPLHPIMDEWLTLIETDPKANMYFTSMFEEVSAQGKQELLADGITDYKTLINVIDLIISSAPKYEASGSDIVGVPIYLVLNYLLNTPGGMDAFLYDKVNAVLFKALETWEDFLSMVDSVDVINDKDGWLCPDAIAKFEKRDGKPFDQMYVCDKSQPHWGFGSWDHFFTRQLRPGARPLDTDPTHITNACESTVFRIQANVKASDEFWLKNDPSVSSMPYSLRHMLPKESENYVQELAGGTVFQAFLSPFDYHRWHSPVTGTIEKIDVLPGTYYAAVAGSADAGGGGALVNSQSFLSAVATRAIFYFRATEPDVGLVVLMTIGMVEVSTCHVTVRERQKINKGDQLGMFHFGGSTQCLIFPKETKLEWLEGIVDAQGNVKEVPVKINTGIAKATRA